jgi:hypothetical protein
MMKWSMLRLTEAPLSRRFPPLRQCGSEAAACDIQLPHRALALRALRQLARGHLLVMGGETALGVRLAGVADIVHIADDLIERGLLCRVRVPACGAACYALSDLGRDTLARGEAWWHEMSVFERLLVEFKG